MAHDTEVVMTCVVVNYPGQVALQPIPKVETQVDM